jgi:hypothetical protein
MNLHTETETAFMHVIRVTDCEESHRGRALVTMHCDDHSAHLFPDEARALAAVLLRAADFADGLGYRAA